MQIKEENTFLQSRFWISLRQNNSFWHFGFAVLISLIVHLFLFDTIWQAFLRKQAEKVQFGTIEAQLVTPKPVKKEIVKPIDSATLKKLPPPKPQKIKEVEQAPQAELPNVLENNIAPETNPVVESLLTDESALPTVASAEVENSAPVLDSQVDEIALNRTQAYQYVETYFDVYADADSKQNRTTAGKAEIVYQTAEGGTKYQIKNLVTPKGLAALIIPDLLQTSEGEISDQGLKPQTYVYQFGTRKNKTYSAKFDWATQTLILENAKGTQTLALEEGTQDLLSVMYQFMFIPPLTEMHIKLTNGKKLSIYDYTFEGEEVLETKLGKISTVHLLHDSYEREEKTEIWLATEYRYLPVKIRKMQKQDKVYEMLVNTIKTDMGSLSAQSQSAEQETKESN